MDSVTISQLGRVIGKKIQLGEIVRGRPNAEGKYSPKFKMTRKTIPLGNGVEIAAGMPPALNAVWLNVTADAAKRLGWPHPANDKPKPGPADIPRLHGIVGADSYGQMERLAALRQIREIDPALGQSLTATYPWLETA